MSRVIREKKKKKKPKQMLKPGPNFRSGKLKIVNLD